MYLVYKSFYDSDFDNQATYYILGLYDNEQKANKACQKEFNATCIKIEKNKNLWVEL